MGVFIRSLKTPDNLLIFTYFEEVGDATTFSIDTPRDNPFIVIQGKLEYVHGREVPILPWMDIVYPTIRSEGKVILEPGVVQRAFRNDGKSIVRALEPDTIGLCIWPLDRDFLVQSFGEEEIVDSILAIPPDEFDGIYAKVIDSFTDAQFDPITLMPVERGVAQFNIVAIRNAALNDLEELNLGDPIPQASTERNR